MIQTRRGFLSAILAGACAPAIVKASSLMPIYVPNQKIVVASVYTSFSVDGRGAITLAAFDECVRLAANAAVRDLTSAGKHLERFRYHRQVSILPTFQRAVQK
jgi:hypothetical protein